MLDFIFYYFNISRLQDFYKHRKKRCVIILLQDFNKVFLLLPKHPYKTLLLFYYIFILLYLDIFINEKGMCFIKWKRKCVGAKKKERTRKGSPKRFLWNLNYLCFTKLSGYLYDIHRVCTQFCKNCVVNLGTKFLIFVTLCVTE